MRRVAFQMENISRRSSLPKGRTLKLWIHKTEFSGGAGGKEDELIVNRIDFPDQDVGDTLEICHIDDEENCFVLQISAIKSELRAGQISVSSNVANVFQLKSHREVHVRMINPSDVTLELVDIGLKGQHISQGDMWRLKSTLVNKCVYVNKKITFCGIRAQIQSLFMMGQRATCGYIGPTTKVTFRSYSCSSYLMIQMSEEMWQFDPYGDLYFEKAIHFLEEYFERWKQNGCGHDLNVVLFSRTFYPGALQTDFSDVKEKVSIDDKGRCYQDFYKVIVQNENVSDSKSLLIQLKKEFQSYRSDVIQIGDVKSPTGKNATSSEGNFLEAINLCLNVFERRYMEQQFDWTGHHVVLVTPGVGLFEVNRNLMRVTKLKTTDSGVSVDLVCLSGQPLHAVPLCKFSNRSYMNGQCDEFSIPYWINCSFYASFAEKEKRLQGKFIPRITVSNFVSSSKETWTSKEEEEESIYRIDFDEYDKRVFETKRQHVIKSSSQTPMKKKSGEEPLPRKETESFKKSSTDSDVTKLTSSNSGHLFHFLVNPFQAMTKSAWDTHRWQHAFQRGPQGKVFQTHRVLHENALEPESILADTGLFNQAKLLVHEAAKVAIEIRKREINDDDVENENEGESKMEEFSECPSFVSGVTKTMTSSKQLLEVIGMDWTSLLSPACLPLTTNYKPKDLMENFYQTPYTVFADVDTFKELRKEFLLSPEQIFKELVFQRLCKSFQIVVFEEEDATTKKEKKAAKGVAKATKTARTLFRGKQNFHDYYLGTGRQYHRIRLSSPHVEVTIFKPKHAELLKSNSPYRYLYHIRGLGHEKYKVSTAIFHKELLDDVNWNSLDNFVFGASDFTELVESWKYWRSRYLLLPVIDANTLIDDPATTNQRRLDNFIRFLEFVNRVRRPSSSPAKNDTRHSSIQLEGKRSRMRKLKRNTLDVLPSEIQDELLDSSSLESIIRSMKDESNGVDMVDGSVKLCGVKCFLGFDAVSWLVENVKNIDSRLEATSLGEKLVAEGHILHASGNRDFIDGFYFYTFETTCTCDDLWMEVAFDQSATMTTTVSGSPLVRHPLQSPASVTTPQSPVTWPTDKKLKTPARAKRFVINADVQHKSNRYEWITVKYDATYGPEHAFSIDLQWLVTTGCLVDDLVQLWSRRATQCAFQMIPVSATPMAHAHQRTGNPFRPLHFVAMTTAALECVENYLTSSTINQVSSKVDLFLLQEAILRKIGFLFDSLASTSGILTEVSDSTLDVAYRRIHVHSSGMAFAQIATPTLQVDAKRQKSGDGKLNLVIDAPVRFIGAGFYWSGNASLARRARASAGNETDLIRRQLVDLCENIENKLDNFLSNSR